MILYLAVRLQFSKNYIRVSRIVALDNDFLNIFFQITPFKETKKAIALSYKTAQKLPFKTSQTFFALHLQLKNI